MQSHRDWPRPGRSGNSDRLVCQALRVEFEKLRKAVKLPDDARFNYELVGRKGLQPDLTAVKLASGKAFAKSWRSLPRERQVEVVERLLADEDAGALKDWLSDEFQIDEATAERISETISYDEAVAGIGLHHSDLQTNRKSARLPYYGEALNRSCRREGRRNVFPEAANDFSAS